MSVVLAACSAAIMAATTVVREIGVIYACA